MPLPLHELFHNRLPVLINHPQWQIQDQSELIGQWLHHTISLMYVGVRHLEFGITYHIVT